MRVQKTFTIVPAAGPAARTPVDTRPMTSKQVRKAYRAANRVPRVSRAEMLRQERAEQERIRKEFEKEKAAAKAKLLREKKRAKEQAEREEKKKKGLPLVSVRPSQDTIAWFVRGNGSGNKRNAKGQDVDEVAETTKAAELPAVEELEEDDDDFPSPKRFCNQELQSEGGDGEENVAAPEPCSELDTLLEEHEPAVANVMEDDFLEGFEVMSDDEISKLSFNGVVAKNATSNTTERTESPDSITKQGNENASHETALHEITPISVKNPEPMARQEFDLLSDDEDDLELEMLALDVVMTSQQRLLNKPTDKSPLQGSQKPTRPATGYEVDLGLVTAKGMPRPAETAKQNQASLMPPPPIPAAPRLSHPPISPIAAKPQAPPLSTQQILFNMDDFFPTSSQQAAELEEELHVSPSNATSRAQAPNPIAQKGPPAGTLSSSPEPPKPFFTSSGSNERIAVALLRSRRTAEQEEEQRQRALELEAIELEEAKKEAERLAREKKSADNKLKMKTGDVAAHRERGQATRPRPVAAPQFSTRRGLVSTTTLSKPAMQRTPLVEANTRATLPDVKSPLVAKMESSNVHTRSVNTKSRPLEAQSESSFAQRLKTPTKASNKENMASPEPLVETKHPMASQESEFGGSWMDELATELSL